ncbi:hypothetical protein K493DRAFT_316599 [Basidiobolus meristosporus CBS 931.73]|uniref:Sphingomyelin synthase-like domain-containing protein n=1 Tax=Basidiobolus meristosporus CBS 931.73 TaxID=1314790 RepID=A0A1Y1Y494_9FUNG|nr:hypothetical protein K493DRAFT_316599 [Basidiobolus meristosporus CBS 931.73]|eukprot:ORX92404.1 hypothetical protein K493DRAFT_316599 [Basidiobolus meristosporus CBS 931.73]
MMSPKKSLSSLRPDLIRFALSILFILIVVYHMFLIQLLSDQRWAASLIKEPLSDLGFSTVPSLTREWVPDFFVMSLLVVTLSSLTLLARSWLEAIVVLRRFVWLTGTLYLLRSITIIVTTLPCPRDCHPIQINGFRDFLWVGLTMMVGLYKTCSDNIFSGHTMIIVSCMMLWSIYGRNKWAILCAYSHGIIGILTIIATRMHYTIDIFLAVLLTFGLYSFYFSLVNEASQRISPSLIGLDATKGNGDADRKSLIMMENRLNSVLLDIVVWVDGLDLRLNTYSSIDLPTSSYSV